MRPVSMLSSLPPKFTPSRTNMLSPDQWAPEHRLESGRVASCEHDDLSDGAYAFRCGRRDSLRGSSVLLADAERLDHGAIPVDVLGLEIVQEPTALSDQH